MWLSPSEWLFILAPGMSISTVVWDEKSFAWGWSGDSSWSKSLSPSTHEYYHGPWDGHNQSTCTTFGFDLFIPAFRVSRFGRMHCTQKFTMLICLLHRSSICLFKILWCLFIEYLNIFKPFKVKVFIFSSVPLSTLYIFFAFMFFNYSLNSTDSTFSYEIHIHFLPRTCILPSTACLVILCDIAVDHVLFKTSQASGWHWLRIGEYYKNAKYNNEKQWYAALIMKTCH